MYITIYKYIFGEEVWPTTKQVHLLFLNLQGQQTLARVSITKQDQTNPCGKMLFDEHSHSNIWR